VVFSDFECSACRAFAQFFESQAQPLFAGQVRVVFKHFPLDTSCNPHIGSTLHPHACQAARLAEAARLVAGNEGFWRTHDYLFAHHDDLRKGRLSPQAIAELLRVDAARLLEVLDSDAIMARIREDIEHGRALGVNSTPAPFLDGRRVPPLCMTEIPFWDRIAETFWQNINQPRPASTRLPAASTTPGSPGPPVAP
jgi:protein-disulfide isomerase